MMKNVNVLQNKNLQKHMFCVTYTNPKRYSILKEDYKIIFFF